MFDLITKDFGRLENRLFNDLMKSFDFDFDDFGVFDTKTASFEDKGDFYELRIAVDKDVDVSNVKIRVDETQDVPSVSVGYVVKTKNSQSAFHLQESLPDGVDTETIKALLEENELVVTVDKVKQETKKTRYIPIDKA